MDDNIKFLKQKDKQENTNFTSNPVSLKLTVINLAKAKNYRSNNTSFTYESMRSNFDDL